MSVMAPGIRLRVPELLKERGWTITRLMRESNLSYPTAHRLAHGDAEAITLETVDKLCKAFGVKVEELIVSDEESG